MSIAFIILTILAFFHWFYQSTVVTTNNQIFDGDLGLMKHELEILEIQKSLTKTSEESQVLEDIKLFYKAISAQLDHVNILHIVMVKFCEREKINKFNEERRKCIESENIDKKIRKFEQAGATVYIRAIISNSTLFFISIAPILILIWFFHAIKGKLPDKFSSLISYSAKHC